MRTARAEQDAKSTVDGDAAYFSLSIPSHSERLAQQALRPDVSSAADRCRPNGKAPPHAPPTERERQCGAGCQL
eukprot:150010-Lingulodinium_polyedra.AAC.1